MSTDTLHAKNRKPLTPKLRFKEFGTDWSIRHLKEVLTLVSRPIEMDDDSPYSLVTVKRRYEGIVPRGIFLGKDVMVKSQFLLKKNDFLISKRQISHNSCGVVPEALEGSIVSNEYSVFVPARNNDVFFFNYFCNRPQLSRTFFLSSIGVHIEKMLFKVDDWLKWKFHFPSLPEQQKIASFLSAVDEKIQQLTRKKELLEQYKKGVMQQLFSGKLRFKDENCKPYPKWTQKRLGDLGSFIGGGTPDTNTTHYWEGDIPWISSSDLVDNTINRINVTRYITQDAIDNSATKLVPVGSLLFISRVGVGKLAVNNVQLCTSQDFSSFTGNREVDNFFLGYFFLTKQNLLFSIAQGTSIKGFTVEDLKSIKVPVPALAEQQKIAGFLTALDAKIESVATQITQTQTFKKGLLQQMFV